MTYLETKKGLLARAGWFTNNASGNSPWDIGSNFRKPLWLLMFFSLCFFKRGTTIVHLWFSTMVNYGWLWLTMIEYGELWLTMVDYAFLSTMFFLPPETSSGESHHQFFGTSHWLAVTPDVLSDRNSAMISQGLWLWEAPVFSCLDKWGYHKMNGYL